MAGAIEHVAFDVGRVAAYGGDARLEKAQQRWGESFSQQDFWRMLKPELGDGIDYWRDLQNGMVSPGSYLSAAVRAMGLPDTEEERQHFAECLKVMAGEPYQPVARLADLLSRHHGISIGILTNNNALMIDGLRASEFARIAKVLVSSHEVHLSKPDPAIYRLYLTELSKALAGSVPADHVLFVDDKDENVKAARDCGMLGFVFPSRAGTMEEALRALAVKLGELSVNVAVDALFTPSDRTGSP